MMMHPVQNVGDAEMMSPGGGVAGDFLENLGVGPA